MRAIFVQRTNLPGTHFIIRTMKALFIFKPSGVQRLFYGPITQQMVDLAPFFFRSVTKPYPWIMRSYFTETMYCDAVLAKEKVDEFEKRMKTDHAYPFSTPTPQLVAHLSLLSPSAEKEFSAAWFDDHKTGFKGFLEFGNRVH